MREITITEMSDLSGKDRKTIKEKLIEMNIGPLRREGNAFLYDSRAALRAIYMTKNSQASLKDRELKAKAEKIEIEVEAMKGNFIDVNEVLRTVRNEFTIVRQRLIGLPAKLAKPLSFIDDPAKIQETVMEGMNECLEELNYDNELGRKAERIAEANIEAANKADAGPVV